MHLPSRRWHVHTTTLEPSSCVWSHQALTLLFLPLCMTTHNHRNGGMSLSDGMHSAVRAAMVAAMPVQAEVTRLRRERGELEDRAEEAEGGLAAAQADMETGRKALRRELADERTEARRAAEEAKLEHSSQVRLVIPEALSPWTLRSGRTR